MKTRIALFALFLVCMAVAFAGCSGTQAPAPAAPQAPASSGEQTAAAVSTPDLVPGPTETLPADYYIDEKDYLAKIPVTFEGGKGQIFVSKITVKLTRADGQTQTVQLGANKGDRIELDGTKQTDRVEVWIAMKNGVTYKTNDVQSPYRTRG
jgi:PBP1b-binding outer membrane lipoprotein LpoB